MLDKYHKYLFRGVELNIIIIKSILYFQNFNTNVIFNFRRSIGITNLFKRGN